MNKICQYKTHVIFIKSTFRINKIYILFGLHIVIIFIYFSFMFFILHNKQFSGKPMIKTNL